MASDCRQVVVFSGEQLPSQATDGPGADATREKTSLRGEAEGQSLP